MQTLKVSPFIVGPSIFSRHKPLGFFLKQKKFASVYVAYENNNTKVVMFVECFVQARVPYGQHCFACLIDVGVRVINPH